jgi:hypothetical protein
MRLRFPALPVLGLLAVSCTALAHDTWFELRADASSPTLLLGTGNRFPVHESRLEPEHLKRHGCARQSDLAASGATAGRALVPVGGPAGRLPTALPLRVPKAVNEGGATTCWASLVAFDVELDASKVEPYFKEVGAGPSLRAAWATEQAAGRPWLERFVKHARLELGGASSQPVGMTLEALILQGAKPKVGQDLRFQLLHEGRPLADQPVEWVNERSPLGIWRRTDAQGQVVLALPLSGRWLLRSVLLRPPAQAGERWQSDFVTLAFEVTPAAR